VISSNLGRITHRLAAIHSWHTDGQTIDNRRPTKDAYSSCQQKKADAQTKFKENVQTHSARIKDKYAKANKANKLIK